MASLQASNNAEMDVYKESFKLYKKAKDTSGILDLSSPSALDKYKVTTQIWKADRHDRYGCFISPFILRRCKLNRYKKARF